VRKLCLLAQLASSHFVSIANRIAARTARSVGAHFGPTLTILVGPHQAKDMEDVISWFLVQGRHTNLGHPWQDARTKSV
jgi:hypothetical protein